MHIIEPFWWGSEDQVTEGEIADDLDPGAASYMGVLIVAGVALALIVLSIVMAIVLSMPVAAHDWYTGLKNELGYSCCGGQDCGPLPDSAVRETPAGYQVDYEGALPLGTDRMVKLHQLVSRVRARPSPMDDGHYHACAVGTLQFGFDARCFFYPNRGY